MSKMGNRKRERQKRISELVGESRVRTQADLLNLLHAEGFAATQATISRDIKELRLARIASGSRSFRYTSLMKSYGAYGIEQARGQINILKEAVFSFNVVGNLVVVKCAAGSANSVCVAIDFWGGAEILGSIAGDDTALVVLCDGESAMRFADSLKETIGL